MLDEDLADLYEVETKQLKRQALKKLLPTPEQSDRRRIGFRRPGDED
jgi:hypothetical protein